MKVVLAHTQKPPSEARIFDKLAYSLSFFSNLKLYIFGGNNFGKDDFAYEIVLLPIFSTRRNLIYRLFNIWNCWCHLYKIKPDVVIVCSPDLLVPAVVYKVVYSKMLIFDIQENFGLNLKFQKSYRRLSWINLQQITGLYFSWFYPFVDRFWLAEKIYEDQLVLTKGSSLVFENRVSEKWRSKSAYNFIGPSGEDIVFLFSGVITVDSGILRAIDFYYAFQNRIPKARLIISGYIPNHILKSKIQNLAKQNKGIEILNEGKWVSSLNMWDLYKKTDVVFISYVETEANNGKVATKFFEAQFAGKPVLCQKNGSFSKSIIASHAGFEVDYHNPDCNDFIGLNDKILSFQPKNRFGLDFVFDAQGLRADFLNFCKRFSLEY